MADNVELLRDPDAYEDARFAALVEDIDAEGIEGSMIAIEIPDGQKISIAGKDGLFKATGPIVLFVGGLPMEAFEDRPTTPKAQGVGL